MSLIAGTVYFTQEDKTFFLVTDQPHSKFFTVKMHKHQGDTALGSLLNGIKGELGIDPNDLRLGELGAWHIKGGTTAEDLISLYTLELVEPNRVDLKRLSDLGMSFASAANLSDLLTSVDVTGVAALD
ncbi:hypothetical protein H9L19_01510 [Weissella diestrammenae]|uniref:Uncharacterized protein n=1 Tax=Weissella diestrammenae TaxID=1162633 RepID=A0A7G9T660_9LACO|nr:hypothetical protein [Weissella diestrammenae]MCM0583375.1 hypothetical protein [Weissella diestrammenae]QNN75585.1 hypothetical protein H9L19_01510 [Weissella diestrammenae]